MKCALIVAVAVLICGAAAPDELHLKDGRIVEGHRISRVEGGYKIHFKNGEVFVPEALVRDCLIEGQAGFEPRTDEEREKVARGLVPYRGKWVKKRRRDAAIKKRLAEHKKRLDEAKKHRKWVNRYIKKGKAFQFEYTIDPETFQNLGNLMDTYYKVFTKEWGIRKPNRLGRLKVCFYHNYDKFLQVSGVGRGVLGYYRFVPPLELNFFYDRVDPEFTIEVMFHEANHYLTHLIDLGFHYPHNVNEAMAEYYGASKWDPKKKKMSTGHILEGRLTEVITDIEGGEWRSLESYLKNELGYYDYSWGWSFVHFMMQTPKYKKKWKRFYLALARDSDVKRIPDGNGKTVAGDEILRVFKSRLKVKSIPKLEKEWYAYIKDKLKLKSHRGYEKAAQSAMGTGQTIKAKRFFKLAIEKGSKNPRTYVRYAGMLRGSGQKAEARKLLEKALVLDPLYADAHARLGQLVRAEGSTEAKEKGKRMMLLAQEIDPDNISVFLEEIIEKLGKE